MLYYNNVKKQKDHYILTCFLRRHGLDKLLEYFQIDKSYNPLWFDLQLKISCLAGIFTTAILS